ncbi:hypothetical protein CP533_5307 [Ophiocordyceps camponoti-saundersi (nom. inval.)]|nr:hypothetical protein CP533_5307 [Ophiocordyceps camponoti-saundersi (nom. inval.)]
MAPLSTTCTLLGLLLVVAAAGSLPGNSSANFHFPQSGRVRPAAAGTPLLSGPSGGGNGSNPSVSVDQPTGTGPASRNSSGTRHPGSSPKTTLLPGTHWDIDTKPAANVKPVPAGAPASPLFYGDADASRAGHFALLSYTFTKPSVNLDHADDTTVFVLDAGRRLRVDFHSQEAFDHAASTWSVARGLLLIVYAQGCGGHGHGERCFFDVDGLQLLGQRRIVARGRAAHPHDVSTGGETEWGWWKPQNSSSSSSSPSSPSRLVKRRGRWAALWAFAKHMFPKGPSVSYGVDKTISWALPNPDVHPSHEVNQLRDASTRPVDKSPWGGEAVLLLSEGSSADDNNNGNSNGSTNPFLHVFCVDCGASGRARIAGRAAWSLRDGLTEGHIEFHTDMLISLKVGIDAQTGLRTELDKELLMTGLPGLNFGPVSVDPFVSIRARAMVDVESKGQLLAGAEMGLNDAHAIVDLVDSSKNNVDGWKPYLQPVLEAKGDMMLSAELGLPVAFECNLRIGPWHRTVAIVDEPSVGADVKSVAAVSRSRIWGGHCSGMSTQLSWRNSLSYRANAAGQSDQSLFDTGRRKLAPRCVHLRGRGARKVEAGRGGGRAI